MIFGDHVDLQLPDICFTGEEKNPERNLIQETCPNRGSNPGPLRDRRVCYRLLHSGGKFFLNTRRHSRLYDPVFLKYLLKILSDKLEVTK